MRFSYLSLLLPLLLLPACASESRDEDVESAELGNTTEPPTTTTVVSSDFAHEDVVLTSEVMARLTIPNPTGIPRCGSGIPILGANEAGRLIVDGPKLAQVAPPFIEEDHDAFQLECLGDMRFEIATTPSRPSPEELLLALDLIPDPENARLDVVDAADHPLFTTTDLSTFIESVRLQLMSQGDSYAELLRQEEILVRVLAPSTYIARKYIYTAVERWDFADGHCESVEKKDTNVTLRSPSHFGIELDLSRLTKHSEQHDPCAL